MVGGPAELGTQGQMADASTSSGDEGRGVAAIRLGEVRSNL